MLDLNDRAHKVHTLSYAGPKTQKVKGVSLIEDFLLTFSNKLMMSIPYKAYTAKEILDATDFQMERILDEIYSLFENTYSQNLKIFARPCPIQPRHGFVDSRVLESSPVDVAKLNNTSVLTAFRLRYVDSVRKIAEETFAADPDGEIIFMEFYDATLNYIVTPNSVTIGMGHDGATAGKNAITLPVYSPALDRKMLNTTPTRDKILKDMGIAEDESPYLELIHIPGRNLPALVQVRSGPTVEAEQNYIPKDVTISAVYQIDSSINLLTWEKEAKEIAADENAVVYHPNGSINSHFGVHCVINNIPYITVGEPLVGDKLVKTQKATWSDKDYEKLAEYIAYYDTQVNHSKYFNGPTKASQTNYGKFALASLHSAGTLMQTRNDYAYRTLAAGITFSARMFSSIVLGEYRHASARTNPKTAARIMREKIPPRMNDLVTSSDRDSIYTSTMYEKSFYHLMFTDVLASYYVFSQPKWEDNYGGLAWKDCAKATIDYGKMLASFVINPNAVNFTALMNEFNTIIHLAHNNGWWLNKIMGKNDLDLISGNPIYGFLNNQIFFLLRELNYISSDNLNVAFKKYQINLRYALQAATTTEEEIINLITSQGDFDVQKEVRITKTG